MLPQIKTIIFDNNGVLTSADSVTNIARFLNVKEDILKPVWEDMAKLLDEGNITTTEFYRRILNHFGIYKNLDHFRKVHLEGFLSKNSVQQFAKSLRDDFEIALLSNFGDGFDECNERWKMEEIFGKKIFVSCKIKMRKPNDDIYLFALDKLKRKPEETMFIDDNKENIKAAEKLGINAILFTNLENLKKDLGKYTTI